MIFMEILKLRNHQELADQVAEWFHSQWGIPLEAYAESIQACLANKESVPQWYIAIENNEMIGGLGVIANDFHDRKDLTPNVCSVYVMEAHRCKGIAGALLNYVCDDMSKLGIDTLYLVTDHTSYYERYGWNFMCMVQGDGEPDLTRMYLHKM